MHKDDIRAGGVVTHLLSQSLTHRRGWGRQQKAIQPLVVHEPVRPRRQPVGHHLSLVLRHPRSQHVEGVLEGVHRHQPRPGVVGQPEQPVIRPVSGEGLPDGASGFFCFAPRIYTKNARKCLVGVYTRVFGCAPGYLGTYPGIWEYIRVFGYVPGYLGIYQGNLEYTRVFGYTPGYIG